jgi:hypothetical protein
MRRLFWIAFGATLGILLFRKVNKTIDSYSPAGVGRSLTSVGDGLRELSDVIREGMAEREAELRVALGVDAGTLSPEAAQSLMQDPSGPRYDR